MLTLYSVCINGRVSVVKLSDVPKGTFDSLLLEAVDEALSTLGEPCKKAFYIYFEKNYEIKKHEIPLKIERFAKAVQDLFGVGARLIEIQIMKNLREKLGDFTFQLKVENLTFTEYVTAVKMLELFSEKSNKARNYQCKNSFKYQTI